ncbi:MAG TPA: hypothetical protein V6C90_00120 [Coleofasciculaceae cyanobacterium]|jgi:hypothetical protein
MAIASPLLYSFGMAEAIALSLQYVKPAVWLIGNWNNISTAKQFGIGNKVI